MPRRKGIQPEATDIEATFAMMELFEELDDVLFWLKNQHLEIRALNQTFADRVKRPKHEILGKTDADLYLPEIARVFMADDQHVLRTGQAIHRKVELLTTPWGGVEWRSTTKLPVWDCNGRIVATTGVSRPIVGSKDRLPQPYQAFTGIIEFCQRHLPHGVNVPQMADFAGLSAATLTRRFREHLQISPGEFLAQMRVSRACQLLSASPLNVTEIALECGYESPAAFSRAFRRAMQQSPREYRNANRT